MEMRPGAGSHAHGTHTHTHITGNKQQAQERQGTNIIPGTELYECTAQQVQYLIYGSNTTINVYIFSFSSNINLKN